MFSGSSGSSQPLGLPGVHRAELAGAGTDRPHHHDGGGAVGPALTDVRAVGFLANGAETVFGHVAADRLVAFAARHPGSQPLGLALHRRLFLNNGRGTLNAVLDGGESVLTAELGATGDAWLGVFAHEPGTLILRHGGPLRLMRGGRRYKASRGFHGVAGHDIGRTRRLHQAWDLSSA